jgi:hypothetical protein
MKDNSENIPSAIFDWLEQRSFDDLSVAEKNTVLLHFTEDTYRELHLVASGVRVAWKPENTSAKIPAKQQLLDRFDSLHGNKNVSPGIWRSPVIWRAAVIFLLGISGALAYVLLAQRQYVQPGLAVVRDTVFIDKGMATAAHIYDTIYLENPVKVSPGIPGVARRMPPKQVTAPSSIDNEALSVLSIRELKAKPNAQKKNSMKHDSSARKYHFVTL